MEPKLWAHYNKKGQAILELAIFGSVLLYLLGMLLNYGLKYNFQQRLMQQAFRKTLGIAATERSGSYVLVKDYHIPDPADPFAVGSVVPVSSSASVVRDYRMHYTAEEASELPRVDIELPDGTVKQRKTAAFRDECNVPVAELEDDYDCDGNGSVDDDEKGVGKYSCVYGSKGTGWWEIAEDGCTCGKVEECLPAKKDKEPDCEWVCPDNCKTYHIRILDNCAGEIVSYNALERRCRKVQDAGIPKPWYCDADYKPLEDLFTFADLSNIDSLSDENKPGMGLQQDYTQQSTVGNTLKKVESTSDITTTDTLDWEVKTTRTIVYNDGVYDAADEQANPDHKEGFSKGIANIIGDAAGEGEITTSVGSADYSWEDWNEWKTNW